jgi:N-acetylmuramoyl-L-alanine amidase
MTHSRAFSRTCLALAAGLWLCGTVLSAQAPTAAVLFQRATDREAALRKSASPSPDDTRRAIAAYELVVRKFPKSGYCDNALWQASGVALLAFRQSNADADRATGERLLKWLEAEYPASPLAKHADERRDAFATPGTRVANTAATDTAPAVPRGSRGATTSAVLRSITREALPGGDRIVLEVDREVSFTSDRIANPDRVFLDLGATAVGDGLPAAAAALKGMLVTNVRLGHPAPGTTRVVFDLAGTPKHSIYPLYNPYRLVIDAEGPPPPPLTKSVVHEPTLNTSGPSAPATPPAPVSAPPAAPAPAKPEASVPTPPATPVSTKPEASASTKPEASAPTKPLAAVYTAPATPSTTGSGDYSLARQLGLGVQRVVIDAGHGGHDPGAQANGVVEKDLVLDVALRLQKLLQEQKGFDVVLTRSTDEFIALEERTAMANRAGADLFLSIHANASRRKDARGLETYFLNFATNSEAEAVAARENATSAQSMGHLPEILKAIALNAKLAESRELASMVQTSLVRRLKPQNASVKDLGVKQAPFVVLIGAQMPSVLAEISFVTNKAEASLLKQNAYKQRIAQALFDAIMKYQTSLKKITTVAAKDARQ